MGHESRRVGFPSSDVSLSRSSQKYIIKILKPYDCCAQWASLYEYGILYQSSLLAVPRSRSGQINPNVSCNDLTVLAQPFRHSHICVMFIFTGWEGNGLLTEAWGFIGTNLDSDMIWWKYLKHLETYSGCDLVGLAVFLVLATYMFPFDINSATGHQLIHEELVLLVHGFLRDWRHRCRQLLSSMGSADRISDESPSPDGRKYLKI